LEISTKVQISVTFLTHIQCCSCHKHIQSGTTSR